eukprot:TRINITY_DN11929_c0_g2_i1.p1 TRINITY_DN11929_c0_g2~~TRINITY_DN11929_c0_g2_i1.p1  ORF type:complete len:226 (-),score=34.65 TRINITY_DN11929_c0_g2_i1:214-891(-)
MGNSAASFEEVDVTDEAVVLLNVYDLSAEWLRLHNVIVDVMQLGGAFHTGVEIHGKEWSYGVDGVQFIPPRTNGVHVYRQTVPMGRTLKSPLEVSALIDFELAPKWHGEDYNLLRRNCVDFSDEMVQLLCGMSVPSWVNRLPKLASEASQRWQDIVSLAPVVSGSDPGSPKFQRDASVDSLSTASTDSESSSEDDDWRWGYKSAPQQARPAPEARYGVEPLALAR